MAARRFPRMSRGTPSLRHSPHGLEIDRAITRLNAFRDFLLCQGSGTLLGKRIENLIARHRQYLAMLLQASQATPPDSPGNVSAGDHQGAELWDRRTR